MIIMSAGTTSPGQPRSFSRIPFTLTLSSGDVVTGELVRHRAPFTIGAILKVKRLQGFVTKENDMVVLVSGITAGLEKPSRRFSRGSVAFLPLDGSVRFVLSNLDAQRPMNHIGEVLTGIEMLDRMSSGEAADFMIGN